MSKEPGQEYVYHYIASLFLITAHCEHLLTIFLFLLDVGIQLLSKSELLCSNFHFEMHQMFSVGDESGLQLPVLQLDSCTTEPCCSNALIHA